MVYSVPKCVLLQLRNIQSSVFVWVFCTQVLLCGDTLTSLVLSAYLFLLGFSWGIIANMSELVICRNFQAIFIPNLAASLLYFSGISFSFTVFTLLLNFDLKSKWESWPYHMCFDESFLWLFPAIGFLQQSQWDQNLRLNQVVYEARETCKEVNFLTYSNSKIR